MSYNIFYFFIFILSPKKCFVVVVAPIATVDAVVGFLLLPLMINSLLMVYERSEKKNNDDIQMRTYNHILLLCVAGI